MTATEAFLYYLDLWSRREEDALHEIRSFHHEKITAIGSARHDIFHGRDEMDEEWRREVGQITNETYEVNWVEETVLDESTCVVNCELEWIRELKRNASVRVLHRVSTVWKKEHDKYQLVSWHSSAPDGARHNEIFPGSDEPRLYPEVSVLFSDFVGFTRIVSSLSAKEMVDDLSELFAVFDATTKKYGLDKVKTIGDSYMLAGGLSGQEKDHAERCVRWAHEIFAFLKERNRTTHIQWNIRVGIHSGPVIGGVIGQEKPVFDLWGDTVNTASRLETNSESFKVNISRSTYELLKDHPDFLFEQRGLVPVKGKGDIDMYFVGIKGNNDQRGM